MKNKEYEQRLKFLAKEVEVKKYTIEKNLRELETLLREIIQLKQILDNEK